MNIILMMRSDNNCLDFIFHEFLVWLNSPYTPTPIYPNSLSLHLPFRLREMKKVASSISYLFSFFFSLFLVRYSSFFAFYYYDLYGI